MLIYDGAFTQALRATDVRDKGLWVGWRVLGSRGWAFGMSPHHGGVDWCLLPAGVGSPLPPWGCRCWGDPWMGVLGLMLAPNKVLVRLGWAGCSWGVMGGGCEGDLGL